jgi:hypothetical protein
MSNHGEDWGSRGPYAVSGVRTFHVGPHDDRISQGHIDSLTAKVALALPRVKHETFQIGEEP